MIFRSPKRPPTIPCPCNSTFWFSLQNNNQELLLIAWESITGSHAVFLKKEPAHTFYKRKIKNIAERNQIKKPVSPQIDCFSEEQNKTRMGAGGRQRMSAYLTGIMNPFRIALIWSPLRYAVGRKNQWIKTGVENNRRSVFWKDKTPFRIPFFRCFHDLIG